MKLFISVDMQNDFMNKDGKLYVQGSEEIKPKVKELFETMSNVDIVFHTQDWHQPEDPELSKNPDFATTFPEHCMAGTEGADFIKEVKVRPLDKVFKKQVFSVFENNDDFLNSLKEVGVFSDIYIAGVSGDVCVYHALEGLLRHKGDGFDYENIYIVTDAIASLDPVIFAEYVNLLSNEHKYIKLIKVDDIDLQMEDVVITENTIKAYELFKNYDLYVEYAELDWSRIKKSNDKIEAEIKKLDLIFLEYLDLFGMIIYHHRDMGRPDSIDLLKAVFERAFNTEI